MMILYDEVREYRGLYLRVCATTQNKDLIAEEWRRAERDADRIIEERRLHMREEGVEDERAGELEQ